MVVAGRRARDTQPPSPGRSTAGDKCCGDCGLWGGWTMDERGEGEGRAQDWRAGLRLALGRIRPRQMSQRSRPWSQKHKEGASA